MRHPIPERLDRDIADRLDLLSGNRALARDLEDGSSERFRAHRLRQHPRNAQRHEARGRLRTVERPDRDDAYGIEERIVDERLHQLPSALAVRIDDRDVGSDDPNDGLRPLGVLRALALDACGIASRSRWIQRFGERRSAEDEDAGGPASTTSVQPGVTAARHGSGSAENERGDEIDGSRDEPELRSSEDRHAGSSENALGLTEGFEDAIEAENPRSSAERVDPATEMVPQA